MSWYEKLTKTLLDFGFHSSKCDPSLFIQPTSSHKLYVLDYADDIIVTGSSLQPVQILITRLNSVLALKQLGSLEYFLGIKVKFSLMGPC